MADSRIPNIRVSEASEGRYVLMIDSITEINAKSLARTFVRSKEKMDNLNVTVESIEHVGDAKSSVDFIPVTPRQEFRVVVTAQSDFDILNN